MNSYSLGIIGGADGPTAVFVSGRSQWELLAVSAALVLIAVLLLLKKRK